MPLPTAPSSKGRRPRAATLALWLAAAAVLGGVFTLYAKPGFLVMMVDQIWSCF